MSSTPKGYRRGTHRLVAPAETVERIGRLAPAFGITRTANVTGLDVIGIPVVVVCRPNSRSLSVAQGKGLDLAAAKASGLMETIELYHAERILRPLRLATYRELRDQTAVIDVDALPRLSVSAFHHDLRILWIEGYDLLAGAAVLLPFEMVHMNYTLPFPPGSGCFAMSSNGLASGNHYLEAAVHALCEVIERDATALWYAAGKRRQREARVDPATVDDTACREVLEKYEAAGVMVALWETTSDVGVPAFRCQIIDQEPNPWRLLYSNFGLGCYPAREVALLRALTEAAQSRLTMIASSRDDVGHEVYTATQNPDVLASTRARLAGECPARSFQEVPTVQNDTFEEDLVWLLEQLERAGVESVVVVDLSREGLELAVVRAVIPGLEPPHEAPGYLPGPRARALLQAGAAEA